MRWFPDKVIVLFSEVEINLYILVMEGNFFKNILTSLNVNLLSEETKCKINWFINCLKIICNKYL